MLWLAWLACAPPELEVLSRPNAVAVGPDGAVYVSDFGHDRIVELRPDGTVVRSFGRRGLGSGELWRVYALAVDQDGSLLVANRRPEDPTSSDGNTWEVKRFVEGRQTEVIPFQGHFTSDSHTMHSLDVRDDGSLLVANPAGGELFLLDGQGRYLGAYGGALRSDAAPHALDVQGEVAWVVDQRSHRLALVGPDGERGVPLTYGEAGALSFPSAVAVCPGRWVAVADLGNHQVQRFGLDGSFLGSFAPERAGPDQPVQLLSMAVSPDCDRLYLADSKGDRLLVVTPEGEVLREVHAVDR
jgi:DNA-binding beta-propeller fold protein YncE